MTKNKQLRLVIRSVILVVLCVAIIYVIYSNTTKDQVEVLRAGQDAPDFSLVDLNGNKHKLSDYEGQGVFLNFWGTWCEPCAKEMPAMDRQYAAYSEQGVQVLAVNIAQSDFEVRNFANQYELSFPVVIDKTKSVMEAYNIVPLPTTVLVNPEGKVEKIITGEMSEADISAFMESIKPE